MMEVAMTRGRRSDWRLRAPLRSPGRPPVARRAERVRFWAAIAAGRRRGGGGAAAGRTSEDAGRDAGVSPVVGSRWFREAGGMPPTHLAPSAALPSGRCLSFAEREEIALLRVRDRGVRELARRLGRAPSTISRELRERRGDPPRRLRAPRHDRAMARRSGCPPAQEVEACKQRDAALLRGGPPGGPDRTVGRHRGARPTGRLDEAPVGPAPAPAPAPAAAAAAGLEP